MNCQLAVWAHDSIKELDSKCDGIMITEARNGLILRPSCLAVVVTNGLMESTLKIR